MELEPNSQESRHLIAFIERVEKLEEDKTQVSEDIKDVYAEAKGTGYDVKAMRELVRLRKMDKEKRLEAESILEIYKAAAGLQ